MIRKRLNHREHRVWGVVMVIGILMVGCATNPNERNNTGNDLAVRGAYREAVQAYQVAQAMEPDEPVPYYNAAISLSQEQDLAAAAQALEQALESADESLINEAYYNLGNVYFASGRYFEAVEAFRAVLERDPQDADARYNYELALLYAVPPTPESQEQQTEPEEGETDPETTPTPQPNDVTGPTPTPPLQDNPPDESATPEGGSGDFFEETPSTLVPQESGRMTIEDAEQLLDAVEQDQQSLSEYLNEGVPAGDPVENDW
jgi:Ca-activated chloride channel homolog